MTDRHLALQQIVIGQRLRAAMVEAENRGPQAIAVKIELISAENSVWDEFPYWIYSRRCEAPA
jgi:hypothetical protein